MLAGYRRGARLEALADWLPIEFLLIRFPWPGHSTGIHDQFRKEPIAIEELPPWVEAGLLWDCDEWNLEHACSKAPESDTESSGDESSGAPRGDDADFVLDELVAKRDELGALVAPSCFRLAVRGGSDTLARFGVPYDYFKGVAKPGEPTRFCSLHGLLKSASYKLTLYGESVALTLAQAWMSKMQHMYDVWVDQGRSALALDITLVAAWGEPVKLTRLESESDTHLPTLERCRQIREIGLP